MRFKCFWVVGEGMEICFPAERTWVYLCSHTMLLFGRMREKIANWAKREGYEIIPLKWEDQSFKRIDENPDSFNINKYFVHIKGRLEIKLVHIARHLRSKSVLCDYFYVKKGGLFWISADWLGEQKTTKELAA